MPLQTKVLRKHFIVVYKVDQNCISNLRDVSDDPCFDMPPSWGICHPDIRNSKSLQVGSYLFFVGQLGDKYYMKGYFKVSSKVDILEALVRFPLRQNVIISTTNSKMINLPWNYIERYKVWENTNKMRIPSYLRKFVFNGTTYFQRANDDHKIDQWKCSSIFNCNISTFKKCVNKKKCIQENNYKELKKNYIIGSKKTHSDWNKSRTNWKEIAKYLKKPTVLKDKSTHRHPEIELSKSEAMKLIAYMNSKHPVQPLQS